MASIKAQGKWRAKERKARKLRIPASDPTDYADLFEQENFRPWSSLHVDEQQLYIEQKRREASAPNTSTTNTPSMANPPPTQADLAQMVHDLGVLLGNLATQVGTLTTAANTTAQTTARTSKTSVARPKAWTGKGRSVEAWHFLAAFFNYARVEGENLNDYVAASNTWIRNDNKWIAAVLNLMEDEARTWALPYLEEIANSGTPFGGDYNEFIRAFNKRFALMDSAEAARDALKSLRQGKDSVAEYQAKFDQFTNQTGWSDTDHRTRFYDGLNETIKDNLTISDRPIGTLTELRQAAQILDQRMRQRQAEKSGKSLHNTPHTTTKAPDAMDVDASRQQPQQQGKEKRTRYTYLSWMKGKCFGCGSTDHAKKDGKHEKDICGHCKKAGHFFFFFCNPFLCASRHNAPRSTSLSYTNFCVNFLASFPAPTSYFPPIP